MKKMIKLLRKIRMPRFKSDETDTVAFDKRLKKVNRARVVNHAGLGGPVFKSRPSDTEV